MDPVICFKKRKQISIHIAHYKYKKTKFCIFGIFKQKISYKEIKDLKLNNS